MTNVWEALGTLIGAILLAIAGYVGNKIKTGLDDKTKADIAEKSVRFVEQVFHDLHGEEKLAKATKTASDMLAAKGIKVSDLELRVLIESAVLTFNSEFTASQSDPVTVSGFITESDGEEEEYDCDDDES